MTLVFGFVIMTLVIDMKKNNIGNRIKEFRAQAKMSQKTLAEMLGVTNRAVSNWESGANGIDVDLIPAICAALNISPNDLLDTPSADTISAEEMALINAFRSLDAPGKAAVKAVLDSQRQRISEYGTVDKPVGFVRGKRIPIIQGTHEAIIQIEQRAKQERREMEAEESLMPIDTP